MALGTLSVHSVYLREELSHENSGLFSEINQHG